MRQAEEDSCKQFFVVVVFFFPSVEYDLFAHLWIESSPSVAVVIWLFGIQGKKERKKKHVLPASANEIQTFREHRQYFYTGTACLSGLEITDADSIVIITKNSVHGPDKVSSTSAGDSLSFKQIALFVS